MGSWSLNLYGFRLEFENEMCKKFGIIVIRIILIITYTTIFILKR